MNAPLPRADVTLEDKFRIQEGHIYLTGTQALTRLPIQQALRDKAAGLNTGGFISGYRGSPLGRYDMELWAQQSLLQAHNIQFMPGVNEDLAATAVWGSQYVGVLPGAKVDGVFGIWYGKGPGVDRSADAMRHLACAGTSKLGGLLAIAGDDHGVKSSSVYNFSDPIFIAAGMPLLYPSTTQELLDLGLHGLAMSRFSGCAVGFKVHNDVVEGGGSIYVAPDSPAIVVPELSVAAHLGPQGLNIRGFDLPLIGEERLVNHRLPAALSYARANRLNHLAVDGPNARLGILSAGKSYQDVMQALSEMGLNEARCRELGVRVGKVGLIWPLDPVFVNEFAQGLEAILVVEEKRGILEDQLKTCLYDLPLARKPRVAGKYQDAAAFAPERGEVNLQGWGELSPTQIMHAIRAQLRRIHPDLPDMTLPSAGIKLPGLPDPASPNRNPGFCSGCPHNRSTKVPDGSRAMVGIGCHGMAVYNDPVKTPPMFAQMGAEGMQWLGQRHFTNERHVFANIGDGTYFHSGFLAIRQSLAAKANITYKILVNGFVSMTGGQPIDGELSVRQIVTELQAEGAQHIFVLTDDPDKHPAGSLPGGVPTLHRSELEAVMLRCRELEGVSIIVYDQPCATERRRLRKRGKWADPPKRTFINPAVCEGCGDCSKASSCLSIEPLETPFGRKRRINQSSCNKDFSCVEGFCPSFVTVHGGALRKTRRSAAATPGGDFPPLPEPALPVLTGPFSLLVTGVGGTGVVTIGQVLGMAAHIEGAAVSVLDVTGLAQKYGAVMSHVRLAPTNQQLHATRIATAEADTVVGCDLVVTAGDEALARVAAGRTRVVVASDLVPTTDFSRNPDWQMDPAQMVERIRARCGSEQLLAVEGLRLATRLMGDAIAANMFMLGAAWQLGSVPLSQASIMRAIELNNVQIEFNKNSFLWGRRAAVDLQAVERAAGAGQVVEFVPRVDMSLDAIVKRSMAELAAYQNDVYARRYKQRVDRAAAAERDRGLGDRFSKAVARYYFKLLAIKDEYEVARLFTSEAFRRELDATFEGDYRVHFNVGAWPFGGVDKNGKPYKKEVGPWLWRAFGLLKRFKGLRGTPLDPFRNTAERKLALQLLAEYERDIDRLIGLLDADTHATAVALAALPEKIRGYGHVREQHAAQAAQERQRLWAALQAPETASSPRTAARA
ncbi:MAG: indolepyruvate ferredoxin oxidoreductase family protein [Burkholderiaceae bacterium]